MLAITCRRRPLEDLQGALAVPQSRLVIGLLAIGVCFAPPVGRIVIRRRPARPRSDQLDVTP